jgi:hypothetical protein
MKYLYLMIGCFLLLMSCGMLAEGYQVSECPLGSTCPYQGSGMMYGQQSGNVPVGPGMMGQIERQALPNATHEEMESLMEKMMAGTLTGTESARLVELMNDYPGPYGMMVNRMMDSPGYYSGGYPYDMIGGRWGPGAQDVGTGMPWWIFGIMGALVAILVIIWIIVGLLLVIRLARKLSSH